MGMEPALGLGLGVAAAIPKERRVDAKSVYIALPNLIPRGILERQLGTVPHKAAQHSVNELSQTTMWIIADRTR